MKRFVLLAAALGVCGSAIAEPIDAGALATCQSGNASLAQTIKDLESERDALAAQGGEIAAQRDRLEEERDEIAAERDELQAERDRLAVAVSELVRLRIKDSLKPTQSQR
jgi:uncharacterized coiled-coil DUF342 family protein